MSVKFYSDDVVSRESTPHQHPPSLTPDDQLDTTYEIQRCIEWIQQNHYKKVVLQFPDCRACDSDRVSLKIGAANNCHLFISLGDKSLGSCCIDENTAQSAQAEAVIHFDHSCLSPLVSLPVLFVFIDRVLDVDDVTANFRSLFPATDSRVVITYSVHYHHTIDKLFSSLSSSYPNIVSSQIVIPELRKETNDVTDLARDVIFGRRFPLPAGSPVEKWSFYHIGPSDKTLVNLMLYFNRSQFYSYDLDSKTARMQDSQANNKLLKQRYFLMEKTKSSSLIGLLIGSVGVADYLTIANHLEAVISAAGRRSQMLHFFNVSPALLANLSAIDVFVVIGCPECSLFDSKEFYRPVITPYELELALNPARTWDGTYTTAYNHLLPGGSMFVDMGLNPDKEADMSLITGKVHSLRTNHNEEVLENGTQLVKRDPLVIMAMDNPALGHLAERSWRGLEQKLGETPVTMATEGRYGIAAGYSHELPDPVGASSPGGEPSVS